MLALFATTLPGVAGAARWQASPDKVEALRALGPDARIAIVELLAIREPDAFERYRAARDARLRELGGERIYTGSLDRPREADPRARFDRLWIELYPDAGRAVAAITAESPTEDAALSDRVALAMTPGSRAFLTGTRWASKTVNLVAGRRIESAPPAPIGDLSQQLPESEAMAEMLSGANERDSLTVFNLNQYRREARYRESDPEDEPDVDGETAYRRYGTNTMPQLFRRGAYPVWSGTPRVVLVGDRDDVFGGTWDEFVLVHYPSRIVMRDMLNDPRYQEGFFHSDAAVERAVVLPGTPDPAYDPRR